MCCWAATIRSTWAIWTASQRCAPSRRAPMCRTACWASAPWSCCARRTRWAQGDLSRPRSARTVSDLHSLREQRLQRTLAAVAAAHPFYRARFRELGITPDAIRSLDDLQRLPTTAKDDYIADPEAFRLRADGLPADFGPAERVTWDIAYTTGTTSGKPSPFYNTTHDAYATWDQARRCNEAEGVRPGDRVANLYPIADFPT